MISAAGRASHLFALGLATAIIGLVFIYAQRMSGNRCSVLTAAYTQALAEGQTYLKIAPSPELLALPDPYNPLENSGVRLLDASLFKGRYYLYFGITPFATLLVPCLKLTGHQLAESEAVTVYGFGVLACFAFILGSVSRRYFPRAGAASLALALLAGVLASSGLLLMRGPYIYQLEIAAAWFHDTVVLVACYLALHDRKRLGWWLALAGLNAGLAVGARPNHLGVAVVTTVFVIWALRGTSGGRVAWIRASAIALVPLAVVAAGVAALNWIRFGSALDFGYKYQLNDVTNFASVYSSVRNVPYNLWLYLFGVPRLTGWFPFFEGVAVSPLPVPLNYYVVMQVYGVIFTAPFTLCAFALLTDRVARPPGFTALVKVALSFAGLNLAFLSVIFGATYRYAADFLPFLALVGSFGLLALSDRAAQKPGRRWVMIGAAVLSLFSVASSISLACAVYDLLELNDPVEFARIARISNQPRLWWEKWRHRPLEQFRVDALLPPQRFGNNEPLLVTGRAGLEDFIYVYYTAPGFLQVGFEAIGRGGPCSNLIAVDYNKPVVFELALGQLWPPAGAYPYANLDDAAVAVLRRKLIVRVNDVVALDCQIEPHLLKGLYQWGRSSTNDAFGTQFTGSKFSVTRVPLRLAELELSETRESYGLLKLEIKQRAVPVGSHEPLVAIGYRNRAQLLSLERDAAGTARFVVTSSGGAKLTSSSVALAQNETHSLEFTAGGLLPPLGSHLWHGQNLAEQRKRREHVQVVWDGQVILDGVAPAPEVGSAAVELGRNAMGVSGIGVEFSGEIKRISRSEVPVLP